MTMSASLLMNSEKNRPWLNRSNTIEKSKMLRTKRNTTRLKWQGLTSIFIRRRLIENIENIKVKSTGSLDSSLTQELASKPSQMVLQLKESTPGLELRATI